MVTWLVLLYVKKIEYVITEDNFIKKAACSQIKQTFLKKANFPLYYALTSSLNNSNVKKKKGTAALLLPHFHFKIKTGVLLSYLILLSNVLAGAEKARKRDQIQYLDRNPNGTKSPL